MFVQTLPQSPDTQGSVLERVALPGDPHPLIGLHAEQSTHRELLPFLKDIASGRRIVAPRSARWSAYHDGGRFSWFSSLYPPVIEPVGFGDSLIQLEALVHEVAQAGPQASTTMVGVGQGGTMAVALASLWPELFASVVAIDAEWPDVPGWRLPLSDMDPLRVLTIGGGDRIAIELGTRGARLDRITSFTSSASLTVACRDWIAACRTLQHGN